MELFYQICEWGLIIALVAFIAVIISLAITAIGLKNSVLRNAKRLYERPLNSVKNLTATGKAIAMQEQVRVQHIAGTLKDTAGGVKETAAEVKDAAQSVHPAELKAALSQIQQVLHILSLVMQLSRATARQEASHQEA